MRPIRRHRRIAPGRSARGIHYFGFNRGRVPRQAGHLVSPKCGAGRFQAPVIRRFQSVDSMVPIRWCAIIWRVGGCFFLPDDRYADLSRMAAAVKVHVNRGERAREPIRIPALQIGRVVPGPAASNDYSAVFGEPAAASCPSSRIAPLHGGLESHEAPLRACALRGKRASAHPGDSPPNILPLNRPALGLHAVFLAWRGMEHPYYGSFWVATSAADFAVSIASGRPED